MKKTSLLLALLWPLVSFCSEPPAKKLIAEEPSVYHPQGILQGGLRTTVSAFSHDNAAGFGTGAQFRLRFTKKVNSEWFLDYLATDLNKMGKRNDLHIGWSVIFYPFEGLLQSKFTPYIIAGHCFDYTKVTPFNTVTELHTDEAAERWSSATQAGLGVHWNITDKFNLSLSSQYMIHLGNNLHTHVEDINGSNVLHVEEVKGASMEGHLLTTLSLNVRLFDLW